jgi:RNA polymerase sigma-70 factor (ECF subfamily)
MDFGPAQEPVKENLGEMLPEATWLLPAPDARVLPTEGDPAEVAAARETLKLAFMHALQHLPPRQRAVLILCEVLRWKATEAAELLDTSVASVNSALQRARATLDAADIQPTDSSGEIDDEQRDLLDRYLDSFLRYDMESLTALLAEDATLSMPPWALWMQGPEDIVTWMLGPGYECEDSRMIETVANGSRAFGQYRKSKDGDGHEPWGLHVLETRDGKITGINVFLDTASLFPVFGLPPRL